VIIDLPRFMAAERPYWDELKALLTRMDTEPEWRLSLPEIQRLHYLYERSSADLARLDTFSTEPGLRTFLESLVSRAYMQIHETREPLRLRWKNLILEFPRAFRRNLNAFRLAVAITLAGCAFGWFAIRVDPQAKAVLMPFPGLMNSPAERVAEEESAERVKKDPLHGHKASFSSDLMTHNIQVTIMAMAFGMTWGAGTIILLFYNGVILGAVAADYILGGQATFLAGWLLPHGSIEIPAILLGGQAGLVLAGALIGKGASSSRSARLRATAPDLFTLIAGAAVLLVWAGIVEAFVSQYHRPVLPYALKISFGACELLALTAFLGWAGRE
jgi:uncharacterized membrane protein SpoIIM required for sporulation